MEGRQSGSAAASRATVLSRANVMGHSDADMMAGHRQASPCGPQQPRIRFTASGRCCTCFKFRRHCRMLASRSYNSPNGCWPPVRQ
jgi:hypothetical protein